MIACIIIMNLEQLIAKNAPINVMDVQLKVIDVVTVLLGQIEGPLQIVIVCKDTMMMELRIANLVLTNVLLVLDLPTTVYNVPILQD